MKTSFPVLLLFVIASPSFGAEAPPPAESLTNVVRLTPDYIAGLAAQLRTNHPALAALEARTRAARHSMDGVRTWDDPAFALGGVVASDRGPSLREDGDLIYGLAQKLPLFGKAAAARTLARAEVDTATTRAVLQFEILRRDLATTLYQAAYEERLLEVGREDLFWLDTMVATAEDRFRTGRGSQLEVLRLQNDRSKRADLLRTETQQRDHFRLAVNRLLNRDLQSPLPPYQLPELAAAVPYDSNLVERAVRFEPGLRLLARELKAADAQIAATRKARLPDVSAGVEGRQYSGDGGFREGTFTVSLSLPWFNGGRYRSDLARDRARREAVEFDAANQTLTVQEAIHQLTLTIDAARREALLYRDEILPRSRQALESAHTSWLNGRGPFLEVMEARRMLVDAERVFAKAVADQHAALGELALKCGGPLLP